MQHHKHYYTAQNYLQKKIISTMKIIKNNPRPVFIQAAGMMQIYIR